MEELLTILNDVDDSIDWEHEEGLIDNRILDSFEIGRASCRERV